MLTDRGVTRTRPARPADAVAAARDAGPDRFPDALPTPVGDAVTWLYASGDFELGLLHRQVEEAFATHRHVDYAVNFGALGTAALFVLERRPGTGPVDLVGPLAGDVRCDAGAPVVVPGPDGPALRLPEQATRVEVTVRPDPGDPPALAVRGGPEVARGWRVQRSDGGTTPVQVRPGGPAHPPHRDPEPVVTLATTLEDGLHVTAAPVLGRPVIRSAGPPRVRTGESRAEALDDAVPHESRHDVVRRADGRWTTAHALGFRYVHVTGTAVEEVAVEAHVRPVRRRGAFVCDDDELNRIWSVGAATLRTCLQGLTVDGIKRDRLPWIGDQALTLLSNAYTFADAQIVLDGLRALGRPRDGYVNGISDYSLWWLVCAGTVLPYFGAPADLGSFAGHVEAFVTDLARHAGPDGVLRPAEVDGGFVGAGPGAVFIDWGVQVQPGRDLTALQVLWYWALRSASTVLDAAGRPSGRWSGLAATLRETLRDRAWVPGRSTWREYLDGSDRSSPYADAFAVLSGIAEGDVALAATPDPAGVRAMGTPFMTAFGLLAQTATHGSGPVLDELRRRWSPMLDRGALTFWEDGVEPGRTDEEMYGRPYGKSLCHAWSTGPAFLLPTAVLGIRPAAEGWREVHVDPDLGPLGWACAVVPTPLGDLWVSADADGTVVDAPAGMTVLHAGERYAGPGEVRLPAGR